MIKKGCTYYTSTACNGTSVSFCAPAKQCQNQTTCAKDPSTSILYLFKSTCIPEGFKLVSDPTLCICPPPLGPYCASLGIDLCKLNSNNCQVIPGTNCGNLTYYNCRNKKEVCPSEKKCALEPDSKLYYLFQKGCIPNGWIREKISKCSCNGKGNGSGKGNGKGKGKGKGKSN